MLTTGLTLEALEELVRRLIATEGDGQSVNVTTIALAIMGEGPADPRNRAEHYQAIREAVRREIQQIPTLRYAEGLS